MEIVEEFEFLKLLYFEVLRYDTPFPVGSPAIFSKETMIGNVKFGPNDAFFVDMAGCHKDPIEWPEPEKFIPDRFNSDSKWFKRADGSNRNRLAFTPFLGGKRVCLGKTFAEILVRFTLPLYYTYFDFEFVNEEHKQERPSYILGAKESPVIPVLMKTRVKVTN